MLLPELCCHAGCWRLAWRIKLAASWRVNALHRCLESIPKRPLGLIAKRRQLRDIRPAPRQIAFAPFGAKLQIEILTADGADHFGQMLDRSLLRIADVVDASVLALSAGNHQSFNQVIDVAK